MCLTNLAELGIAAVTYYQYCLYLYILLVIYNTVPKTRDRVLILTKKGVPGNNKKKGTSFTQ